MRGSAVRSAVDRICAEIQRHLHVDAKPQAVAPLEKTSQFPSGLGDTRMRFELERYFAIHCTSFGFDDSHADDAPDDDNQQEVDIQDFQFVDPESLKARPENLTRDDAFRWDMFDAESDNRRNYLDPLPTPAEIDYRAMLSRLDRKSGLKYGTPEYDSGYPGLLEQFLNLTPATPTPEITENDQRSAKRQINHSEAVAQ